MCVELFELLQANNTDNTSTIMLDKDLVSKKLLKRLLVGFGTQLFGLDIVEAELLSNEQQRIEGKRADLVARVKHSDGEIYILHVEIQNDNLKWSSLCAQKNKGLWQKFGVAPLAGCRAVVTGSCLDIPKNVKTATPRQPLQAQTDPTIMLRREP